MCFEPDSAPPIAPIRGAAASHDELTLEASDGSRLAAFFAVPREPTGNGLVVLPDVSAVTVIEKLELPAGVFVDGESWKCVAPPDAGGPTAIVPLVPVMLPSVAVIVRF